MHMSASGVARTAKNLGPKAGLWRAPGLRRCRPPTADERTSFLPVVWRKIARPVIAWSMTGTPLFHYPEDHGNVEQMRRSGGA
jgi:hypothetical protein